jgi:hypothetical protein
LELGIHLDNLSIRDDLASELGLSQGLGFLVAPLRGSASDEVSLWLNVSNREGQCIGVENKGGKASQLGEHDQDSFTFEAGVPSGDGVAVSPAKVWTVIDIFLPLGGASIEGQSALFHG